MRNILQIFFIFVIFFTTYGKFYKESYGKRCMKNKTTKCQKYIRILGRKGFCEILFFLEKNDRVILSDLLKMAGHGTIMDRREELLELGLICDKKIKEGRRNYIVYELTPKGEKILEELKNIVKILE